MQKTKQNTEVARLKREFKSAKNDPMIEYNIEELGLDGYRIAAKMADDRNVRMIDMIWLAIELAAKMQDKKLPARVKARLKLIHAKMDQAAKKEEK